MLQGLLYRCDKGGRVGIHGDQTYGFSRRNFDANALEVSLLFPLSALAIGISADTDRSGSELRERVVHRCSFSQGGSEC